MLLPRGHATTKQVVQAIEQRLQLLDRLPRVRITAWLKKLRDEVSSNVTWQKNRNAYARLLLEQVRQQRICMWSRLCAAADSPPAQALCAKL